MFKSFMAIKKNHKSITHLHLFIYLFIYYYYFILYQIYILRHNKIMTNFSDEILYLFLRAEDQNRF
jgi:hypothetical protein